MCGCFKNIQTCAEREMVWETMGSWSIKITNSLHIENITVRYVCRYVNICTKTGTFIVNKSLYFKFLADVNSF